MIRGFTDSRRRNQTNHDAGVQAEAVAAAHLESCGYTILQRRYKTKFGEIDLIVEKAGVLAFVEVKMRARLADALECITARARRRIEQSALFYISEYPEKDGNAMRFDVIAIARGGVVTHLEHAWETG